MDDLFLNSLLKGIEWDAIIDFMSYSTEQFKKRVNNLLNATKHYIFLSSARVYADTNSPITEDSPRLLDVCNDKDYLNTDEYALAKARQEDILRNSFKKNWTIIRPYITFSEYRLQLGVLEKERWLYCAINGQSIIFSEDIAEKYTTLTYGEVVAQGISKLIGCQEAMGEAFHITGSTPLRWSEILQLYVETIKEFAGNKPNVITIAQHNMKIGGGTLYQWKYDRLYNRTFDNKKIKRLFPEIDRYDTKTMLSNALKKFLQIPLWDNVYLPNINDEIAIGQLIGEYPSLRTTKSIKNKAKILCARLHILNYIKKLHHCFN